MLRRSNSSKSRQLYAETRARQKVSRQLCRVRPVTIIFICCQPFYVTRRNQKKIFVTRRRVNLGGQKPMHRSFSSIISWLPDSSQLLLVFLSFSSTPSVSFRCRPGIVTLSAALPVSTSLSHFSACSAARFSRLLTAAALAASGGPVPGNAFTASAVDMAKNEILWATVFFDARGLPKPFGAALIDHRYFCVPLAPVDDLIIFRLHFSKSHFFGALEPVCFMLTTAFYFFSHVFFSPFFSSFPLSTSFLLL